MKGAKEKYADKGLVVIGVGIQDSESNIRDYARTNAMDWPVIFDRGNVISDQYGIPYGAGAVFIDRQGVVRGRFVTGFSSTELERELGKVM